MELGLGRADSAVAVEENGIPAPVLLVHLEPWPRVFFRNLRDLVWKRSEPVLHLASKPADFWADVFVTPRLPWGKFFQSIFGHVAVGLAAWGLAMVWPRQPQIMAQPTFHHEDVIYYQASDYLPPLNTGDSPPAPARKGDPVLAPQPVISVPPEADNSAQTIVTPPALKLNHEVPLPNVVAWQPVAPSVPLAATTEALRDPNAPSLTVPVVAPAPDPSEVTQDRRDLTLQQTVVAPPPVVQAADIRRIGDINIGHVQVVAPAPSLPMPEQRSLAAMERAAVGNAAPTVVPPAPSLGGTVRASGGGRMIALNLHPLAPGGPVEIPNGNRRGRFAATPEGKAGAAGTPSASHGSETASAGQSTRGSGSSAGKHGGAPSGLYVGAGPSSETKSVAGNGSGHPVEMASVTPPRVGIPAKETLPENESDLEKQVFGDHKSYAMTLNVPNLNSAGGSWVIHFAELDDSPAKGDLSAPVATTETDPGYPLELMRRNIRGTVLLYAVIRKDGTVGDVRVLRGVDDALDRYACAALEHWRFQPATKNGTPVPLAAVVSIPFRPMHFRNSF
jgi:TonB family protein